MESKDLFSAQSKIYKNFRPEYPATLYEFILQHVPDTCLAWDAGTGNGQVAKVLSAHFTSVYASDISEQQLAEAHQEENICYVKCRAENCGLPDKSADLITVAQAIHWFDFDQFNNEVRRVARPKAIIAVWGYELLHINKEIDALILDFYHNVVGNYWSPERKYIQEAYQSIPFPFEIIDTPSFQIELVWSLNHLTGYLNSWSSVQKYIKQNHTNPVDDLIKKIEGHWDEGGFSKVVFPVFTRMGRVN